MAILNTALLPLFTFFAPGFIFFLSFHGISRLTRIYNNKGILFDAAGLVLVSFLLNAITFPIYYFLTGVFLDSSAVGDTLESIINNQFDYASGNFWPAYWYIFIYFVVTCVVALYSGRYLMSSIEKSKPNSYLEFIGRRVTHNALFPLVQGAGSAFIFDAKSKDHSHDYVMAAVLTDITAGNRSVIYYGAVLDLVVSGLNKVECVTLSIPEKFLFKVKDDTAETPSQKHYVPVFDGQNYRKSERDGKVEIAAQYITIYRENIKNISYERFNYKFSVASPRDQKAAEILSSRRN